MRLRSLSLLLLLAFLSRPAEGSPLQMFGVGGRSPGAGATGVATADNFDCIYINPAGLADIRKKRFNAGTLLGGFDLEGVDRTVDAAVGAEVGAVLPIPFGGRLKDRVGLGVAVYVPTSVLNRVRSPKPGTPFYALLENRSQVVGLQVGVGLRLNDEWSVGASVLTLAALRGHIDITTDAAGRFTSISEQQLIPNFAPIFGGRWRAREDLTAGLTLRFESRSAYDILVTNDLADTLPVTLPELRIAGVSQYDPLTLAAEAGWRASPSLLVTGHLAWERWSAFPLPSENPVAGMTPQEPTGFHDTIVPRVAVEWTRNRAGLAFAARAGYFFAWSPAPEMTGQQALLDNDRHVVTVGLGLGTPGRKLPYYVDAWFQTHLLVPRDHDRPGDEPDVQTSGRIFVGGLVMGVDL